jgi:preprotein translocase subunit SecG
MYTVLLVMHTILVLFLIVMVLLQRSDSDGLGGLGGGGGNQFMTGRGAANFMTRTTAILATIFMITSLVLAVMANKMTEKSIIDTHIEETVATEQPAEGAAKDAAPAEDAKDAVKGKAKEKAPATPAAPVVPKPE